MIVKLVVVQGKPEGKEIPIRTPKFLIGRGTECHLRPNSEMISRHHCLITQDDTAVRVRDLGSTNGTAINGSRIEGEVLLNDGDLIQIGPLGFKAAIQQAAPVAAVAKAAPVPAAAGKPGSLGSKATAEGDIEQWLMADARHDVPDSGSGVYKGDTQMLTKTTVDQATDQDTKTDITAPPMDQPPEIGDQVVPSEEGPKLKLSETKKKIEKTREDTSQAAADILRRMMERRPRR